MSEATDRKLGNVYVPGRVVELLQDTKEAVVLIVTREGDVRMSRRLYVPIGHLREVPPEGVFADVQERAEQAEAECERLRAENRELQERYRSIAENNGRLHAQLAKVREAGQAMRSGLGIRGPGSWETEQALSNEMARWDATMRELDGEPGEQAEPRFKAGDLVLYGRGHEIRLRRLYRVVHDSAPGEWWVVDAADGGFARYFVDDSDTLLERDGTPTDAGLRRLAERAGFSVGSIPGEARIRFPQREVWWEAGITDRERQELGAALEAIAGVRDA